MRNWENSAMCTDTVFEEKQTYKSALAANNWGQS